MLCMNKKKDEESVACEERSQQEETLYNVSSFISENVLND